VEQEIFLKDEGCDEGQGFLYAQPLDIDALKTFYFAHNK